jgi:hypothetical protein
MRKLKSGFSSYSANELAELGANVGPAVASMAIFAGIHPTPAEIAAAVEDLRSKIVATGTGAKIALKASMERLAALLSTMSINLMGTADMTETNLAATKFPLVKDRERTTAVPPAPGDLRLRHGAISGQVVGSCRLPMEKIRLLELQWTLDPTNGPWTDAEPTTNSRGFKIDGLPRGKDVWVRVRARNVIGAGGWSDPATIMAI